MRADDQDKSAAAPNAGTRPADKLFLGPEFVTWLYFYLQHEGFEVELADAFSGPRNAPEDNLVRFAVGRRSTLKSLDGTGARVSISGPGLDDSGEMLQAIRRGAFIDVLALQMQIGERIYEFSMYADGGIGSVKLPDLMTPSSEAVDVDEDDMDAPGARGRRRRGADVGEILSLRMSCLEEIECVVDALFQRFVTRRLARAWATEDLRAMRAAVAARLAARLA